MKLNSIKIGKKIIGGGFPVLIQTMWKSPLTNQTDQILSELDQLSEIGTDLIRFAVPDAESVDILAEIAKKSPIPVVADIHFDYKIALKCIKNGIHKIRINPGNIGSEWKVKELILAARDFDVPIRVGVNGGSLPVSLSKMENLSEAMVLAAEKELNIFEQYDFKNVVFSLKSSDIDSTVMANKLFKEKYDYPLHLGLTEAGPLIPGIVKSTIALHDLLSEKIGDTIRVSLSDSMVNEVLTAKEILKSSGHDISSASIISCPRCGRASFNTYEFLKEIEQNLQKITKNISIAVMGCIVNGPGEARHADLGITGSGENIVIFKKGAIIKKGKAKDAVKLFLEELKYFD